MFRKDVFLSGSKYKANSESEFPLYGARIVREGGIGSQAVRLDFPEHMTTCCRMSDEDSARGALVAHVYTGVLLTSMRYRRSYECRIQRGRARRGCRVFVTARVSQTG